MAWAIRLYLSNGQGGWIDQGVFRWAQWMGTPLDDPASPEDESAFLLRHLMSLIERVRGLDYETIRQQLERFGEEEGERARQIVAAMATPPEVIPSETAPSPGGEPWLAMALFNASYYPEGFSPPPLDNLPTRSIGDLVFWGRILKGSLPKVPEFVAAARRLRQRGWLRERRGKLGLTAEGFLAIKATAGDGPLRRQYARVASWMEENAL